MGSTDLKKKLVGSVSAAQMTLLSGGHSWSERYEHFLKYWDMTMTSAGLKAKPPSTHVRETRTARRNSSTITRGEVRGQAPGILEPGKLHRGKRTNSPGEEAGRERGSPFCASTWLHHGEGCINQPRRTPVDGHRNGDRREGVLSENRTAGIPSRQKIWKQWPQDRALA